MKLCGEISDFINDRRGYFVTEYLTISADVGIKATNNIEREIAVWATSGDRALPATSGVTLNRLGGKRNETLS